MAGIQVHTVDGWVDLNDLIPATIKCDKCSQTVRAEGAGFMQCDPPDNVIYFCGPCRDKN